MLVPPLIPSSRSGRGEAELGEEDPRERVVVVLAGVHEHLLVALAQRARYGRGLDELRPVADDGEDPHAGSLRRAGSQRRWGASVGLFTADFAERARALY